MFIQILPNDNLINLMSGKPPGRGRDEGMRFWAQHVKGGAKWYPISMSCEPLPAHWNIQPNDIQPMASTGCIDLFADEGIEAGLKRIIVHAQGLDSWTSFTADEVNLESEALAFYVDLGYLNCDQGTYNVTIGLVMDFWLKFPATSEVCD